MMPENLSDNPYMTHMSPVTNTEYLRSRPPMLQPKNFHRKNHTNILKVVGLRTYVCSGTELMDDEEKMGGKQLTEKQRMTFQNLKQ